MYCYYPVIHTTDILAMVDLDENYVIYFLGPCNHIKMFAR
jgi:hypothetical protein